MSISNSRNNFNISIPLEDLMNSIRAFSIQANTAMMYSDEDSRKSMRAIVDQLKEMAPPIIFHFTADMWHAMIVAAKNGTEITVELTKDRQYWRSGYSFKAVIDGKEFQPNEHHAPGYELSSKYKKDFAIDRCEDLILLFHEISFAKIKRGEYLGYVQKLVE